MKKLCVLGSINTDLVAMTPRYPLPGETVIGGDFHIFSGGKGANQAVAAGRLGAHVHILGMVGNDEFGRKALNALHDAGVKTNAVEIVSEATGVACIQINSEGQNAIVVCPGANAHVNVTAVDRWLPLIADCDILLLQLEIPIETVCYAVERAFTMGKTILLDPAPAQPLPIDTLRKVTIITPNETELQLLTGIESDVLAGCQALNAAGCGMVLHKAGGSGAYLYRTGELIHYHAYPVDVIDTTAAGDCFNAALACALVSGKDIGEAILFANAAGAIATTRLGAQNAMPDSAECEALMRNQ